MSTKAERAALEAVARHFAATLEGTGPAALALRGQRIALQVTTVKPRASRNPRAIPRLRCDRVALRLVDDLRTALERSVPARTTVMTTITAPIRLPARTAASLETRIRALVAVRRATGQFAGSIHGNRVQVRVVKGGTHTTTKLIGFVHNPDTSADALFELTRALLDSTDSGTGGRARGDDVRWLVVAHPGGPAPLGTYRNACDQLGLSAIFARILLVHPGGRIETLMA